MLLGSCDHREKCHQPLCLVWWSLSTGTILSLTASVGRQCFCPHFGGKGFSAAKYRPSVEQKREVSCRCTSEWMLVCNVASKGDLQFGLKYQLDRFLSSFFWLICLFDFIWQDCFLLYFRLFFLTVSAQWSDETNVISLLSLFHLHVIMKINNNN